MVRMVSTCLTPIGSAVFNSLPVHSIVSIDVVPVPKDLTTKILQKKYLGIESDIIRQQRVRNKNNDFSSEISYASSTISRKLAMSLFLLFMVTLKLQSSELRNLQYLSKMLSCSPSLAVV